MMNIVDLVAISMMISRIDIGSSMEKEFTPLIFINTWMVYD